MAQRVQRDPVTPFRSVRVQPGIDEEPIHGIGEVPPRRAVGPMEDQIGILPWFLVSQHRYNRSPCLGCQRDISVLVILDVKPEIGLSLDVNKSMHQIHVGEFEHSLFAWPQSGIAGQHEPFQTIREQCRTHSRPSLFGLLFEQFVLLEGQEGVMDFGIALQELHPACRIGTLGNVGALFREAQHRFQAGKHLVARNRLETGVAKMIDVFSDVIGSDLCRKARLAEPFDDLLR